MFVWEETGATESMNNLNSAPAVVLEKTALRNNSLLIRPVADNAQIVEAWRNYQELKRDLLTQADYQNIQGKNCIKKSGWRKIQTAFGISDELIKEERKTIGNSFVYEITVKVSSMNGRFAYGVGSCASSERKFAHAEHDVRSTAHTRAKNRAISDLVGGGEVSAEEMMSQTVTKNSPPQENATTFNDPFDDNQDSEPVYTESQTETPLASEKQRTFLVSLISERVHDPEDREKQLEAIDAYTKSEAHKMISEMLNNKYN